MCITMVNRLNEMLNRLNLNALGFFKFSNGLLPILVKVFYGKFRVENGLICSMVEGVNIKLDDAIWNTIGGRCV